MLGQGNRNLAQIVTVLGTVLSRGNALVEPADAARMVTLLQQMQSSLPPQVTHHTPTPHCYQSHARVTQIMLCAQCSRRHH